MPHLTGRSIALLAGSAVAGALSAASPARAEDGRAPDVILLCDVTLRPVFESLGAAWRDQTDVPLQIPAAPRSDLLIERTKYGFPFKVRVPTKLGFKNPKLVTALFVTNSNPGGFWEDRGYNWFSGS